MSSDMFSIYVGILVCCSMSDDVTLLCWYTQVASLASSTAPSFASVSSLTWALWQLSVRGLTKN